MNLFALKLWAKALHPSNSFRVSPGNAVHVGRDRLRTRVVVDGRDNRVTIDPSARLRNFNIEIRGSGNHLTISEGCVVDSGQIELFGDDNEIHIGPGSAMNEASIIAHWGTRVRIGAGCLFSAAVDIRTTDSHSILNASGERINKDMDVTVGDRVWLGRGASVGKGANIGDDVVIGSMAVVTGAIPSRCIAAGIPARVITHDVTWTSERV